VERPVLLELRIRRDHFVEHDEGGARAGLLEVEEHERTLDLAHLGGVGGGLRVGFQALAQYGAGLEAAGEQG
jgi:hypothetical protein